MQIDPLKPSPDLVVWACKGRTRLFKPEMLHVRQCVDYWKTQGFDPIPILRCSPKTCWQEKIPADKQQLFLTQSVYPYIRTYIKLIKHPRMPSEEEYYLDTLLAFLTQGRDPLKRLYLVKTNSRTLGSFGQAEAMTMQDNPSFVAEINQLNSLLAPLKKEAGFYYCFTDLYDLYNRWVVRVLFQEHPVPGLPHAVE